MLPLERLIQIKRALTVGVTIRALLKYSGGVLLSHTVSHAVPSTLRRLTSVFEMDHLGVASRTLWSNKKGSNRWYYD